MEFEDARAEQNGTSVEEEAAKLVNEKHPSGNFVKAEGKQVQGRIPLDKTSPFPMVGNGIFPEIIVDYGSFVKDLTPK